MDKERLMTNCKVPNFIENTENNINRLLPGPLTVNHGVVGSSPTRGAKKEKVDHWSTFCI